MARIERDVRNLGDPLGLKSESASEKIGKRQTRNLTLSTESDLKQSYGRNNITTGPSWESDEPIVVMKWGNAHGAKGLYYYKRFQLRRRPD